MKLKKIKVKNFRCFGPEETVMDFEDLTAIIGANSSGKTALMHSLLKLFGESSKETEINRADFHVPSDKTPEEIMKNEFSIEVVFEFPELKEDGQSYAVPVYYENFAVDAPGEPPYLRVLLEATWVQSSNPDGVVDCKFWYVTSSENASVTDKDKKVMNKYDRSRIKVIYVPAVREPSSQLKNASGTILWRALKGINWSDQAKGEIREKISLVDDSFRDQPGVSMIQKAIKSQWKNYHNEERYSNAQIKFNSTDLENILKKIEVEFTPTETIKSYKVESLGDGLKSLFYLSLVDSLLEIENHAIQEMLEEPNADNRILNIDPPVLTVIAIEEPENHISPQLLGMVIKNLERIAQRENSQTIVTSHNPSIIKRIEPEKIRHFRICKETMKTVIKSITLPEEQTEELKYIKEAIRAYPELYFAKLVILGEGDSEEIILPKVIESAGYPIDCSGISIVPLGGRHVNHFWRLLSQLDIPYITLLDLDRERNGGGWGRIKYVLNQLIKIGKDKNELLECDGAILSDEELNDMHEWELNNQEDVDNLQEWCEFLEGYDVYFSNPLDIDFTMLECFTDSYKGTISSSEGPYIKKVNKIINLTDEQKNSDEFKKRVEEDVRKTLKAEGGPGTTYTDEQRELMIWYNYFFLSRGKPTTHLLALSDLDESLFRDELPEVFRKINQAVYKSLTPTVDISD
ncbi:ATP-dependent nuclease [Bacillus wiedmannii]|uniref:ATP-dependent nuclease n=1 Tax=Bacillus wiedmannii TaxID=1890302 RepID=UPI0021D0A090|nr:AAA family ATPase [Bacillus wiedmannii]MCU5094727.1 AAA family ATPase [Bacillus wiedmannii]